MGMLRTLTVAVLVLALGSAVHAADMATPFVKTGVDQNIQCFVTNLGTKPVLVTVKLINLSGSELGPVASNCAAQINPGHSCDARLTAGLDAYCLVTSTSIRIRAGINSIDESTDNLVTVVPATR